MTPLLQTIVSLMLWAAILFPVSTRAQVPSPDREDYKTQLDAPSQVKAKPNPDAFRILYIGDSITRHGTSEDTVRRLGWDHVAGMAATADEKDYAHLLGSMIQGTTPASPVELYFHTSGGSGSAKQRLSTIAEALPIQPHLVIIQLGEHEKEADGADSLRLSYEALLTSFDQQTLPPRIIATGVWSLGRQDKDAKGNFAYTGWASTVENTMRSACEQHGISFVSVSDLARDPACRGWGENPGVKWHPNDQGHAGYASKIFAAYQATTPTAR